MADHSEKNAETLSWASGVKAAFEAATKDGTLKAVAREAVKDVRNTVHEVFFGRPEGHGEPGAPLNPTQGEIAEERREEVPLQGVSSQGAEHAWFASPLPSPSDIAKDRDIQADGRMLEQKSWQDRERERQENQGSNGGDGFDRQKERIKPEEERQKQQEREQGRGGRC